MAEERDGEDKNSDKLGRGKPSGEASGRVGGITEQQNNNNSVSAARLASPLGSFTSQFSNEDDSSAICMKPRIDGPKPFISGTSKPMTNAIMNSKSMLSSTTKDTSKSIVNNKKSLSDRSNFNCLKVDTDAKSQLKQLVEELESEPDPQPSSSLLYKQGLTNSLVNSASIVSSTSTPSWNGQPCQITKDNSKQNAIKTKTQIPESVAKINSTGNTNLKEENFQMLKQSSSSCTKRISPLDANMQTKDFSTTIMAVSAKNGAMTQSLPPEKATQLLESSKNAISLINSVQQKLSVENEQNKNKICIITSVTDDRNSQQSETNHSSPIPLSASDSIKNINMRDVQNVTENGIQPEQYTSLSTANRPKSSYITAKPYTRGKSEDLRPAIDTVGKINSSFERYKRAAAATAASASSEHIVKPYRGSRSRELNPTIEAASEKLTQPNSTNVKKISPFEAYKRSRSRELGSTIEQLQKQTNSRIMANNSDAKSRMTSPPPPGLPQSPTSIARLSSPPPSQNTGRSQLPTPPDSLPLSSPIQVSSVPIPDANHSPMKDHVSSSCSPELHPNPVESSRQLDNVNLETSVSPSISEYQTNRISPIIAPNGNLACQSMSTNTSSAQIPKSRTPYERAKSKLEKKIDRAKSPTFFLDHSKISSDSTIDIATQNMYRNEQSSAIVYENEQDITKEKIKKHSTGDTEKPKSVYKKLASKFSKSSSNVTAENGNDETTQDEKFKLKRPSIFIKGKTEKSSSRSSVQEVEPREDAVEKKTSRKLSDALNKFLGRKTDDSPRKTVEVEVKSPAQIPTASTSDLAKSERDISKIPSRYRSKVFSKSHENLNKYDDEELNSCRSANPIPDSNVTIESATKSICESLSQLENDITSRIGSMNSTADLRGAKTSIGVQQNRPIGPTTSVQTLNSYGYSPALATRRHGQTISKYSALSQPIISEAVYESVITSTPIPEIRENCEISKITKVDEVNVNISQNNDNYKNDVAESVKSAPDDERCFSPTSWGGDSVTSAPEDLQGILSDSEEGESVMDRITRKSFYSRFQDGKRRRSRVIPASKFDEDQQLAAAKARLLGDDSRKRDSFSPIRATSPPSIVTRTSIGSSIPEWESAISRRNARCSVPRTISLPASNFESKTQKDAGNLYVNAYRDSSRDRKSLSKAAAAGAAAGYQAAERESSLVRGSIVDTRERSVSVLHNCNRDSSLSRLRSPSPPNIGVMKSPPPQEEIISTARDELTRRLIPLTKLAGSRDPAAPKVYRRTTTAGNLDLPTETSSRILSSGANVYRRTTTTGSCDLPQELTSSSTLPRPAYRRTNTMHLPSAEASVNRPTDFRALLQPVNRRYSTAR